MADFIKKAVLSYKKRTDYPGRATISLLRNGQMPNCWHWHN